MRRNIITFIAVLIVFALFGSPDAALAQQGGSVGMNATSDSPSITYNVSGVNLGPRTLERDGRQMANIHVYGKGAFSPGATIEIWGTARNRLVSGDYDKAKANVTFQAQIVYVKKGSSKSTILSDTGFIKFGPGGATHEFRVSATIPADAKGVSFSIGAMGGRSTGSRTDVKGNLYPSTTPTPPTKPTPPSAIAQGDGVFGIWESNWGMITIAGTNERITGYWDQGPKQRGQITGGNFDPATRRLYFTYYQDWSKTRGSATLTLSADGTVLSGPWKHESGGGGTWTIKLKELRPPDSTPEKPTRDQPGPAEPPRAAAFTVEAGKRTLSQGGSVTVPVSLNNVDGLANMNINVHYDPAVVRPARNAARGNLIPQSLFEANVRDRGVIRLGFAQRDDIRGTGTLAQIPFEAVGRPGTRTPLRLEVTTAGTAAGSRVAPAQLIHGEITITGKDGRLPGDTSGTGDLTALDAMNALKMSVGNLPVDKNADIDRDGSVTARDATLILQQVVGR